MSFDLKHFKKMHEDEMSATLRHPKGHEIRVAKRALKGKLRKDLESLPMHEAQNFAVGGDVQGGDEPSTNRPWEKVPTESPGYSLGPSNAGASEPDWQGSTGVFSTQQPNPEIPQQQMQTPESMVQDLQSGNMKQPPSAYADAAMKSSLGMGMGAIEKQMQAEQQLGQSKIAAADLVMKQMKDLQDRQRTHENEYLKESDTLGKEIAKQEIDPHKVWHDKSAPQKISTAIGLLLGGIGGGMMGQENPAMKFLQAQMDRDLDSQKQNLGKKQNLLSAYHAKFRDLNDAYTMTRAGLASGYAAMIDKAAAQSMDPMAQARAEQAKAQLLGGSVQGLREMAFKNAAAQGGAMGGGMNWEFAPPEMRERAVTHSDTGETFLAPTKEDAKEIKDKTRELDDVKDAISDMRSFIDSHPNGTMPFTSDAATAQSIRNRFITSGQKLTGINRLNERELEIFGENAPDPGSIIGTAITGRELAKLNYIDKSVKQKQNAIYKHHLGVNYQEPEHSKSFPIRESKISSK